MGQNLSDICCQYSIDVLYCFVFLVAGGSNIIALLTVSTVYCIT